jgi:hypothetical protein
LNLSGGFRRSHCISFRRIAESFASMTAFASMATKPDPLYRLADGHVAANLFGRLRDLDHKPDRPSSLPTG